MKLPDLSTGGVRTGVAYTVDPATCAVVLLRPLLPRPAPPSSEHPATPAIPGSPVDGLPGSEFDCEVVFGQRIKMITVADDPAAFGGSAARAALVRQLRHYFGPFHTCFSAL